MKQLEGFIENTNLVCKLHKSLYGLKQASRSWYKKIDSFLIDNKLNRIESDHIIYTHMSHEHSLITVVYVDDLLIIGNNHNIII